MNYMLDEHAEINRDRSGLHLIKVKLPLLPLICELADAIGVYKGDFAIDSQPGDKECQVDVAFHGLIDWHSDDGRDAHNRRLLIFITDLPMVIQVGDKGRVRAESRIDGSDIGGKLRAVVLDQKEDHRVIASAGYEPDTMAHYESVIMLDIPFKNNFLSRI